jgi:hypothetical protein
MSRSMSTNLTEAERLEELVEFAQAAGGEACYKGWERKVLRSYLEFHLLRRTCGYVRKEEVISNQLGESNQRREIVAMGIGWQLNENEMVEQEQGAGSRARREFIEKPFRWQESNARGDSFLFCDLIASERSAIGVLVSEFEWRWPNWRRLKLFAIRRGRLVRYDGEKMLSRMELLA